MKLIDKSALVAEIDRLLLECECNTNSTNPITSGNAFREYSIYNKILSFIDTLEVKEVDSKLTLEDISMLRQIMFDYNRQVRNEMSIPNNEGYCKEVLKRFKAQKG